MLFEVVNPSDACTMEAEDLEVAAIACVILSSGQYALREIGGDHEVPMFAFWGAKDTDAWFKERFGRTLQESADVSWVQKCGALIACLESVLLGGSKDREVYNAAMQSIADEAGRAKFRETWHDKHRSSMNDICAAARELAAKLKASQPAPAETEDTPHG